MKFLTFCKGVLPDYSCKANGHAHESGDEIGRSKKPALLPAQKAVLTGLRTLDLRKLEQPLVLLLEHAGEVELAQVTTPKESGRD